MSEQTNQTVTISVDLKKNRLRIHKTTLSLLGMPKYVQLLVSPESMMVAIRGVDNKDRYGHRVNLSVLSSDNSYELYSKQLIEKLCALITDLDTSYNYRLTGEFITDENAAVFSLNTLQKIEPLEAK